MSSKLKWYQRKRKLLGLRTEDENRLCQKCLSTTHFTHQCKQKSMKHRKKESATQKLTRLRFESILLF